MPLLSWLCVLLASSSLALGVPEILVDEIKAGAKPVSALKPYLEEAGTKSDAQQAIYTLACHSVQQNDMKLFEQTLSYPLELRQQHLVLHSASSFCRYSMMCRFLQAHPDLDVSRFSNKAVAYAIESGIRQHMDAFKVDQCRSTMRVLMEQPRFENEAQVRDIIADKIVAYLAKHRDLGMPVNILKSVSQKIARKWEVSFDYEQVANACIVPVPAEADMMESMVASALLDRHAHLFGDAKEFYGGNAQTRGAFLDFFPSRERIAKHAGTARGQLFTPHEQGVLASLESDFDALKAQAKIHNEYLDLAVAAKLATGAAKGEATDKALAFAITKSMEILLTLQPGVEVPLLINGCGHAIVATYRRDLANPMVGTYTTYNTGDGTMAADVHGRIHHYEVYEGVPLTFIQHAVELSIRRNARGKFRDVFYPPASMYSRKTVSPNTLKGQRAGSCAFRSGYSYLLAKTGSRGLYLKTKIFVQLEILSDFYGALAEAQADWSKGPMSMTFAGHTFPLKYLPVWVYVRQSGIVERTLLRQAIRHIDDASIVDPAVVVDACTKYIRAHCEANKVPKHGTWSEWPANNLWESWVQPRRDELRKDQSRKATRQESLSLSGLHRFHIAEQQDAEAKVQNNPIAKATRSARTMAQNLFDRGARFWRTLV